MYAIAMPTFFYVKKRGCPRFLNHSLTKFVTLRVIQVTLLLLPKLPPRFLIRCCASFLARYFDDSAAFLRPAKPASKIPLIAFKAVSSS